jgi:hypothetical protein
VYREFLSSRTTLFLVPDLMAPLFPLKWDLAKHRKDDLRPQQALV